VNLRVDRPGLWRYTVAGGLATLSHYLLAAVLITRAGWTPGLAASVGAALGAIVGYTLHHAWAFAGHGVHPGRALWRFACVAAAGIGVNGLLVWGLSAGLGIHWLVAQGTATLFVLLTGYALHRRWTFGSSPCV
jgi:putative flippase GtrA